MYQMMETSPTAALLTSVFFNIVKKPLYDTEKVKQIQQLQESLKAEQERPVGVLSVTPSAHT